MGWLGLMPGRVPMPAVVFMLGVGLTSGYAQEIHDIAELSLDSLLDNIVLSASRHEETLKESPANVCIVTRAMIVDYGCETIGEALALAPGIYITDDYSLSQIGVSRKAAASVPNCCEYVM